MGLACSPGLSRAGSICPARMPPRREGDAEACTPLVFAEALHNVLPARSDDTGRIFTLAGWVQHSQPAHPPLKCPCQHFLGSSLAAVERLSAGCIAAPFQPGSHIALLGLPKATDGDHCHLHTEGEGTRLCVSFLPESLAISPRWPRLDGGRLWTCCPPAAWP